MGAGFPKHITNAIDSAGEGPCTEFYTFTLKVWSVVQQALVKCVHWKYKDNLCFSFFPLVFLFFSPFFFSFFATCCLRRFFPLFCLFVVVDKRVLLHVVARKLYLLAVMAVISHLLSSQHLPTVKFCWYWTVFINASLSRIAVVFGLLLLNFFGSHRKGGFEQRE